MEPLNFIFKDSFITVIINNRPVTVNNDHEQFSAIVEALKNKEWDKVPALIDRKKKIMETVKAVSPNVKSQVRIQDDKIFFGTRELHGALVTRVVSMMRNGFDISGWVLFIENLMQNPSYRAVEELYNFLDKCNLPITDDGCFLAYKKVKADWMDIYSGTIHNGIGKTVEVQRNMVDEDASRTCSAGLHFCSYSYLDHYHGNSSTDRVLVVKINPRDVVAIPIDYNNAKGRCCKYEVVNQVDTGTQGDAVVQESVGKYDAPKTTAESILDGLRPSSSLAQTVNDAYAKTQAGTSGPHVVKSVVDSLIDKAYSYAANPADKPYTGATSPVQPSAGMVPQEPIFTYRDDQFYEMTAKKLMSIYNDLLNKYGNMGKFNRLKEFKNKKSAVSRIKSVLDEIKKRF